MSQIFIKMPDESRPSTVYNAYSHKQDLMLEVIAGDETQLKEDLIKVHNEIRHTIAEAIISGNHQKGAKTLMKLHKHRSKLIACLHREKPSVRNGGITIEHSSIKIFLDFLELAGQRHVVRDLLAQGYSFEKQIVNSNIMNDPKYNEISFYMKRTDEQAFIIFDSMGRIIETDFDDDGHPVMVRYLVDNTGKNPKDFDDELGTYATAPLSWITQYRTKKGKRQSRAFTGLGTLNYDWQ